MKNKLLCLLILFFSIKLIAQNTHLQGTVSNQEKKLPNVKIHTGNDQYKTITDTNGKYDLALPAGKHKVVFYSAEYGKKIIVVELTKNETKKLDISFSTENINEIDEVKLRNRSAIQEVKETPFNVVAIDAKQFYNTTMDLGQILDKASGIKIRESGGVGSNMNINLNGFTGNNVKIFMDGVPMQGFGSAFQLNNIPVGIADRIEVYKGVVPIEFGADAMGGVINIVTNQSRNSYMDFSTSYGSFNTHKTNLNLGYTSKSGFTAQLNAYQNSSDNDYKVKTEVKNLQTQQTPLGEYHWVKRFNDAYHNEAVVAKVGFVKKSWADRFLIGATLGSEYAEIQQGYIMSVVFGEKNRRAKSNLYSLSYEKRNLFVKGLNVRVNANYNITNNRQYDTINKSYNWIGESIIKNSVGEYGNPTLSKFKNKNKSVNANIAYQITPEHSIMLNDVFTTFKRFSVNDAAIDDADNVQSDIERVSSKNVLGLSYRYMSPNKKWTTNVFGKQYNMDVTGPVNIGDSGHPNFEEQNRKYNITGYGIANTYNFKYIQLKASFEKAYRLPTDTELFGDEVLEIGSAAIKAEESLNYNLGATFNKAISKNSTLYLDMNLFYRDTSDFIRRVPDQREGGLVNSNWGNVTNLGVDAEVRYYYKNRFAIGGNVTYQNMVNMERYTTGNSQQLAVMYKDRIPNIPYFFGNADATYYFHDLWGKGNTLSIGYTFNFLNQFYLNWPSLGASDSKDDIPTQMWNDINVTYAFQNGKYNISFEANNINNELLFDNFYNQKPGRRFALKFRYFITSRQKK